MQVKGNEWIAIGTSPNQEEDWGPDLGVSRK